MSIWLYNDRQIVVASLIIGTMSEQEMKARATGKKNRYRFNNRGNQVTNTG